MAKLARWVSLFIACSMLLLACGGAEASTPAQSAGGYNNERYRGGAANERKVSAVAGVQATADRDGDGILDVMDKVDEPAPAPAPGRGGGGAPPPAPPQQPSPATTPPKERPAPNDPHGQPAQEEKRETQLIIYTARVTMAVYQVEQGLLAVEKIAKDMGGYLSLKRDREITIRVPRGRFEPSLAAIDKIGDVLHRDIQAQDVTDEFVDTEIRIKNARAMQVRLRTLLERAAVKEALEIEKELARVTQELELLEGKLKLLKDKIAFSTITVTFEPRGSTIQASRIRLPFPFLTQLGLPNLLRLEENK